MSTPTPPLPVTVLNVTPRDALAIVDGVRVRIRSRRTLPPLWLCDEHPGDGRTSCEHIAALAATPVEPHLRLTPAVDPTKETHPTKEHTPMSDDVNVAPQAEVLRSIAAKQAAKPRVDNQGNPLPLAEQSPAYRAHHAQITKEN